MYVTALSIHIGTDGYCNDDYVMSVLNGNHGDMEEDSVCVLTCPPAGEAVSNTKCLIKVRELHVTAKQCIARSLVQPPVVNEMSTCYLHHGSGCWGHSSSLLLLCVKNNLKHRTLLPASTA